MTLYTLIRNLSTVTYNYTLMIVVLIYPRKSFPFQTNKQTKTIDDPKDFERRSLHIVSRGQKSYVLILEITHCAFSNRIYCCKRNSSCCVSFSCVSSDQTRPSQDCVAPLQAQTLVYKHNLSKIRTQFAFCRFGRCIWPSRSSLQPVLH